MKQLLELEDVVEKIRSSCLDLILYAQHQRKGTLSDFYETLVGDTITDIASLSLARAVEGLDPIEDPEDIRVTLVDVSYVLSAAFGKPPEEVQHDLRSCLRKFPAKDYRIAQVMRHNNQLH